jgi:hypothetical protein
LDPLSGTPPPHRLLGGREEKVTIHPDLGQKYQEISCSNDEAPSLSPATTTASKIHADIFYES